MLKNLEYHPIPKLLTFADDMLCELHSRLTTLYEKKWLSFLWHDRSKCRRKFFEFSNSQTQLRRHVLRSFAPPTTRTCIWPSVNESDWKTGALIADDDTGNMNDDDYYFWPHEHAQKFCMLSPDIYIRRLEIRTGREHLRGALVGFGKQP